MAAVACVACGEVKTPGGDDEIDLDAPPVARCTVATQNTACGAHEVCNEAANACECAPAYQRSGDACVFDSAPRDIGFQDPAAWTRVGSGAGVDPTAVGNLDPGAGVIDRTGMCSFGRLAQTFVMPPRDKADAMKLVVTHTGVDPMQTLISPQLSVGVNGVFSDATVLRNTFKTDTFCLGPRAYGTGAGSPVEFTVATFGGPVCSGTSTATIAVDQLAVQVASPGECPDPNTVVNGDFEGGNAGWTFTSSDQATAAILGGVGDNASSAARLATVNRCSEASMTGTIAFPAVETNAAQAIEVSFTGTSGARLAVQLANKKVATIIGSGATKKQHICVPAWAAGTTTSLGFFMQRQSGSTGCGTALSRTFTLDSIRIVNDPACGAGDELTDPGFERIANVTGPAPGWGLTNGHVNDLEPSLANIVNAPALARTGNGVLRLSATNECGMANAAELLFTAPAPSGGAGPAIKFFANVATSNARSVTRATLQPAQVGGGGSLDLPETGVYTQSTLCIPPGLAGRRIGIRFAMADADGSQSCVNNIPEEVALIDDVTLATDPACPAQ